MNPGDTHVLHIERPALGGRMIARVGGQVVLVSGAIPGETARVRIERRARGVTFGAVTDVLEASPDRRPCDADPLCGGRSYAHIAYPRQLALKRACIADALHHVGRGLDADVAEVMASPEQGYRLRARFHWQRGTFGFLREGSHELCDPAAGGQVLPGMLAVVERLAARLPHSGAEWVDIVENMPAHERVAHVRLLRADPLRTADQLGVVEGLTGFAVEASHGGRSRVVGQRWVVDTFAHGAGEWRLRHGPASFFQANRHLLPSLVRLVIDAVDEGPVIDLFAGVGLFGIGVAAERGADVTLVEGDMANADDLRANARQLGAHVRCVVETVERFLDRNRLAADACVVADPPRTGLPPLVRQRLIAIQPHRIVYVSCDPATFARDARVFVDAGFSIDAIQPLDLFPGTPHIEMVATLTRH